MRKLEDKKTGLTWYSPRNVIDGEGCWTFATEDIKSVLDITQELNSWSRWDSSLYEYVSNSSLELGDLLNRYVGGPIRLFYAYDSDKLVSVVLMNDEYVPEYTQIESYVEHLEHNNILGLDGRHKLLQAKLLLEGLHKSNNAYCEVIVTNPHLQYRDKKTVVPPS